MIRIDVWYKQMLPVTFMVVGIALPMFTIGKDNCKKSHYYHRTQQLINQPFHLPSLLTEYEYYPNGSLKRTYETISDQPRILVAEYHYNALGELTEKNLHGSHTGANPSFLQSVDYQYDIRGAMTHINNENLNDGENDLFGMRYLLAGQSTSVAGATVPVRYDGLVSTLMWNTKKQHPLCQPCGRAERQQRQQERSRLQL